MENSFKSLISSANSILVLLPNKPYLDQVASGLSLYLSLTQFGKNVSISTISQITVEFSRLVAVDRIQKEVGNKNLVIGFKNYPSEDIDKVNYDIENGQFKLTISPKNGKEAPRNEQINLSYSGVSADLVILVGGGNEGHFEYLNDPEIRSVKILHVGTRLLEVTSDIEVLSFARPASSTSEVVASLIKESEFPVDADIATNLVAGIEDQSKGFQGSDVSADTFMLFAELLKLGGRRLPKVLPNRFPQGAIPNKPYNDISKVRQVEQAVKLEDEHLEEDIPLPEEPQDVPNAWTEPKIFTGTSIS